MYFYKTLYYIINFYEIFVYKKRVLFTPSIDDTLAFDESRTRLLDEQSHRTTVVEKVERWRHSRVRVDDVLRVLRCSGMIVTECSLKSVGTSRSSGRTVGGGFYNQPSGIPRWSLTMW